MNMRIRVIVSALAAGLYGVYPASAQLWSPGDSLIISGGSNVTVSADQPALVRFTDNGSFVIEAGGSVSVTGAVSSLVGSGIGESGTLSLNGGSMSKLNGSFIAVGYLGGTGTLNIANGATLNMTACGLRIASNEEGQRHLPSYGTVTVNGTLFANSVEFSDFFLTGIEQPYAEAGRLILNAGGLLETAQLTKNDCASSTLLFNGGTLRAKADNANFIQGQGVLRLVIADGAKAVFDTNGKTIIVNPLAAPNDTVLTLAGDASGVGDGGLIKTGAGALIFRLPAACNTFTGSIEVVAGALDLGRRLADNQRVTVHPGATFALYDKHDAGKVTVLTATGERVLYTVGADTDALDLGAVSATFYDDRLGGPLTGAATLSGTLAYTSAVGTVGAPFRLIGQGGTLNVTNTGLESKAIQVEGPGTFNFMGDRSFTAADAGTIALTDGGYRQHLGFFLADASPATPATLGFSSGRFSVGNALDIGVGGFGAFAASGVTLACGRARVGGAAGSIGVYTQTAGANTFNAESWIGFDSGTGTLNVAGGSLVVNGDLRVAGNPGDQSVRAFRPDGTITVSNALLRCNTLNFTPWWPNTGVCSNNLAGTVNLQSGAQLEITGITKNDDPISTIRFSGGLLRARTGNANFFTMGQTYSTLRIIADAGAYATFDTGSYTVGIQNPAARLFFTGAGGFRKLGTGILSLACDLADYTGDTMIDAGALQLGANDTIPGGPGFGDVYLASGAILDLNGKSDSVNRLRGYGAVLSTNTLVPARLGVLADGSDDTWERTWVTGNVVLEKLGTGTLTLTAARAAPTNLTVSAGTVRLASSPGYPFYRFKVEGVKNPAVANSMQLAEFKLYEDGTDITGTRVGILYDATGGTGTNPDVNAFPANEMPEKGVDNVKPPDGTTTNNKWLDFRANAWRTPEDRDRVWLRIDFAQARRITSYNWATANDAVERDPAAWRLQGSYDGATWTDIDVRSGYVATATRNAWVEPGGFAVSSVNTANVLSDIAQVTVGPGAMLDLSGQSETIGSLVGYGTVNLNGATLTLAAPDGSTAIFGGALTGSGTLVKTGMGTQGLACSNACTGDIIVDQGTLAILGDTPCTWFRFTIKENRDNVNVTQLSELALYSAGNVRRNLNLVQGASVSTLLPGQFATPAAYAIGTNEGTDKLFDNKWVLGNHTKWCLINNTPTLNNPSTWRTVVMRLADDTPEIIGYNLCTANDQLPRNPVTWTLEASIDGVAWTEVAAKSRTASPDAYYTWYNNGVPYALDRPAVIYRATDAINDNCVVEIRSGATLSVAQGDEVIGALRVDMLGAGTLTKLTPKPNGALHLVNVSGAPRTWVLPLTIGNVSNSDVLKTWTVYADGAPLTGYTLSYDSTAGRLRLLAKGTIIILR